MGVLVYLYLNFVARHHFCYFINWVVSLAFIWSSTLCISSWFLTCFPPTQTAFSFAFKVAWFASPIHPVGGPGIPYTRCGLVCLRGIQSWWTEIKVELDLRSHVPCLFWISHSRTPSTHPPPPPKKKINTPPPQKKEKRKRFEFHIPDHRKVFFSGWWTIL